MQLTCVSGDLVPVPNLLLCPISAEGWHGTPHQHTGSEMEVLTTVGEQVGCMLALARMEPTAVAEANHVELVLSSGPVLPRR